MNEGTIYCVKNPLFPHLVKIGKTKNLEQRNKDLSGSNIPEDFEVVFSYRVADMDRTEKAVHKAVAELRYTGNSGRETEFFYACAVDKAEAVVSEFEIESSENETSEMTDETLISLGRRPPFNFEKCGIKSGTILVFKDDESEECRVIGNGMEGKCLNYSYVEYKNEVYTLSKLCKFLTDKLNIDNKWPQGPRWFKVKGESETLDEKRKGLGM